LNPCWHSANEPAGVVVDAKVVVVRPVLISEEEPVMLT
jgi:hypothetical protein